ncbi:hypothetical protein QM012_008325 [Aureobasidium pullulans]|uniref:t-SNARE coiled-coil homology domain-containing protein n=1 Tax=Aureobasidium pullulans TaxID=5580 RepID=A0ABR0TJ58_AURPU
MSSSHQSLPEPNLEDTIADLVDLQPGSTESETTFDKIQNNAKELEELSAYANQLSQYWNSPEVSNDSLQSVKAHLIDDALNLNALIEGQSELAKASNRIRAELSGAQAAAQANFNIAMKLYHKAKLLPAQTTQLLQSQAKIAVADNEQTIMKLLEERETRLVEKLSLASADRAELERLRAEAITNFRNSETRLPGHTRWRKMALENHATGAIMAANLNKEMNELNQKVEKDEERVNRAAKLSKLNELVNDINETLDELSQDEDAKIMAENCSKQMDTMRKYIDRKERETQRLLNSVKKFSREVGAVNRLPQYTQMSEGGSFGSGSSQQGGDDDAGGEPAGEAGSEHAGEDTEMEDVLSDDG